MDTRVLRSQSLVPSVNSPLTQAFGEVSFALFPIDSTPEACDAKLSKEATPREEA